MNKGNTTPARILIVDDEISIRSLLNRVLVREGYDVVMAANAREALDAATKQKLDLVILDLNLPDIYGEEVCQQLRQLPSSETVPVLILTGKSGQGLSARCLNGGADDYIAKPFDIEDIIAHIRALLRRSQGRVSGRKAITNGRITIRVAEHMVLWKGRRVETLAPKEFEMLRYLIQEAPKVLDKNTLALKVWGIPLEQLNQRTLDVHMRRIRRKLGPTAAACLITVPAIGYQWLDESPAPPTTPSAR